MRTFVLMLMVLVPLLHRNGSSEPLIEWQEPPLPSGGARGACALADGTVLDARPEHLEGGTSLVCYSTADLGATWQRLGVIARTDDPQGDLGDLCLLALRDGRVLCSYRDNHYRGEAEKAPSYAIRIAESADHGQTWQPHSTVMEVSPPPGIFSQGLWSSFLLETDSGALQCYYDDEYTPTAQGFPGHQWLELKTWEAEAGTWGNQVTVSRAHDPALLSRDGVASVVELYPRQLVCVLESVNPDLPRKGVIRAVTSSDGGATWSWQQSERPIVYAPRDANYAAFVPWLTRLADGTLLCTFVTDEDNGQPVPSGSRARDHQLDVKYVTSTDNGTTWSPEAAIADNSTHQAYIPSLLAFGEGTRQQLLLLWVDFKLGLVCKRGAVEVPVFHNVPPVNPAYPPVPPEERLVGLAYSTWFRSADWHNVWGTPELGYYASDDRAVIRKHAEWIADAGVDFIWVDWSNNVNYIYGETQGRPDFDMIENSTIAIFEEFSSLARHPKISIFIGCPGEPEALTDGRLQRKADQVYDQFIANPRFAPLYQTYLGKPLLVVYLGTPTSFQTGVPEWRDERFTVRYMTGFITQQGNLRNADLVGKYGYWSWEDRDAPSYAVYEGQPEEMTLVAAWRPEPTVRPATRRGGETFRAQWERARLVGPRFAMVVSWNEWTCGEQPSVELSKDLEPSLEWGHLYLDLLKEEIAKFKQPLAK